MRLLKSPSTLACGLALAVLVSGCATICDEVADEAEAGGCAVGVLPEDLTEQEVDELTTCEGDRELRATCLVENTNNVCSYSEEEAAAVDACVAAGAGAK